MSEKTTFDDILNDYFFSKVLRPASEWSYRKVVKTFTEFSEGKILPESICRLDVLKWRRHVLNEQNCSKRTWNNKVAHMRALFNHAITHSLVTARDNPFNGVVVKPDRKRKKTLTRNK